MGQDFWDSVDLALFSNVDTVRYCPNCMLVYKPDPNQHIEPNMYCPRCGYKLIKNVKDEFEEHRQPGGGTDGGSGAKFY
jgi:rubredoxin